MFWEVWGCSYGVLLLLEYQSLDGSLNLEAVSLVAFMYNIHWLIPPKRFLADLNEDMCHQGRHILLLCDNVPSHKHNPTNYSHVQVEFLVPNLTAWIQPMDGGIIASFKAQYKQQFIWLALDQDNQGAANMYEINQLQAMKLAASAWNAVTPSTIHNCWRHVGLPPSYNQHAPELLAPVYEGQMNPPKPVWYENVPEVGGFHPEFQDALAQFDLALPTEHEWTDEDIINQLIAERGEGFFDEEDTDLDLEDFYYHHNSQDNINYQDN